MHLEKLNAEILGWLYEQLRQRYRGRLVRGSLSLASGSMILMLDDREPDGPYILMYVWVRSWQDSEQVWVNLLAGGSRVLGRVLLGQPEALERLLGWLELELGRMMRLYGLDHLEGSDPD